MLMWSNTAQAGFTSVTVIGDSFSDGGNHETALVSYFKLLGDPFPDRVNLATNQPYHFGFRYTSSYTAVEHLAYNLGLYNKAQFFNYAVGGISTNELSLVIDYISKNHTFDPKGLFVIEIGQNDILHNLNSNEVVTTRIMETVKALHRLGARHFMIVDSLYAGTIPAVINLSEKEKTNYTNYTITFNQLLAAKINQLTFKNQVTLYDLGGIVAEGTKQASQLGITNTINSCIAVQCANPNEFLWLDDIHLTGAAHRAIGYSMFTVITPKAPIN
jgi:phospholipase/lecithinase/hemolysin